MWDVRFTEEIASMISDEARAKHHAAAQKGSRQQYQGLTFWTPNINIFRDPRWGRGQETWGEDPFLTGELGAAFVRGLQGKDPAYLKVAACAKHFAVHSGPEALRHQFDVRPSPRDFRETYLPAFRRLCREGVEAFMPGYNAVYGEPCCGSPMLLQTILREEWGFRGHVVSDCWAIQDFHLHHKVTDSPEASSALALRSGCDLNCGQEFCDSLEGAALLGMVSEAEIDQALARLLRTRFRLGMFDLPARVPFASISTKVIRSERHRRAAYQAAVRGTVLLANRRQTLPFGKGIRNVLLTGPLVASTEVMLGNYFGLSPDVRTLAEGMAEFTPEGVRMDLRQGCLLTQSRPNPADWAAFEAARADAVVCALGLSPLIEGEEGDAVESATHGDRARVELPAEQEKFFGEIVGAIRKKKSRTRIVVVLFGGGALAIPKLVDQADAVLWAGYPGEAGGSALAAILWGRSSPGGRLPVSFPRSTSVLPPFKEYSMKGRTYRFMKPRNVLFPFGFGLDYTRFRWSGLRAQKRKRLIRFTLKIRNEGDRFGEEVVQIYRRDSRGPRLLAFQRIRLAPRQTRRVSLQVPDCLWFEVDQEGREVPWKGRQKILVSAHAPCGKRCPTLRAAIRWD
jgi:beta-glucosidase